MTARRAALVLAFAAVAFLLPFAPAPGAVHATCGTPDQDVSDLFSVSPPAPNLTLQGEAPFQVVITFVEKTVTSGPLSMSVTWGDGSSGQVVIVSCGDEVYSFAAQQLSHTFTTPGTYPVQWHLNSPFIGQIDSLAVIVTVTAAATQAPPTPTAVPTATPQGAAPTPVPTAAAAETAVTTSPSVPPTASASVTPSPTPTNPLASTPTAAPTATPTPTPTPAAVAVVATATQPPPAPEVPQLVLDVPDLADISTNPNVALTNLVLAGVTVWVFFSSVLFNQTLQQNRTEVEGWVGRFRPKTKRRMPKLVTERFGRKAAIGSVLVGTGLVYGFLEPSFGFNRVSVLLFSSVVIGVGLVGLFFAGLEAWIRGREPGVAPVVSPFPLVLAIGVICVLASRVLGLHPGVMYGFAASCVVTGSAGMGRFEGRVQAVTVGACILLSVGCWLLLGPARALPDGWPAQLLQGVAVIVFVGGMEGLLVDLMPLDVMDGAKIYRWNRVVWVGLVLVSAFLVWHVLLNTQRSYFESLRPASSWSVLAGFVVYTLAGVLFWSYFAVRGRRERRAAAV